mgnify:CR=1 FL=1
MKSAFSRVAVVAVAASFASSAFAFDVTNNTLVGFQVATSGAHTLVEYDFAGNIVETLNVTGMADTGVGVAVIGTDVFVSDVRGNVSQVNLTTGAIFNSFTSFSSEGLGDDGTNLLALNYTTGFVERFTTGGSLLQTVPVAAGGTGIDGDATGMWVGMYSNGTIVRYDNAGNVVTTVATGLSSSAVSALGWDATGGVLWVATGFGDDRIRSYDVNGNLLANFSANNPWINGLDVVTDAVPEPATMTVLAVGGLLAARRRRRK